MACVSSTSAGFGGAGPVPMKLMPLTCGCVASSSDVRPTRTVTTPTEFSSPSSSATLGLRMSASMSSTERPDCAIDSARFVATSVLPSFGSALETRIAWLSPSMSENCRFVRSTRNASARLPPVSALSGSCLTSEL